MARLPLERLAPADYPVFTDCRRFAGLPDSIGKSLIYLRRLPPERLINFGSDAYPAAHIIASLEAFKRLIEAGPDNAAFNRQIRGHYRVYRATGRSKDNEVLYTGYYEPVIPGRLTPSAQFAVPLFGRPTDLVEIDLSPFAPDLAGRRIVGRYNGRTVVPYPERAKISDREDFHDLAPPIAWVRDEYDLFNLQIQGSGKVDLGDGRFLAVHFDSSNGHPYRSIGRLLTAEGKIKPENLSMQSLRDYLHDHPDEVRTILNHNPRYVFFQVVAQGPIGALGVPLTAGRSIALDRSLFPLSALAYVTMDIPLVGDNHTIAGWEAFGGFVLAQDTGSAITGPGRADFFWGSGAQAELAAGHMKQKGRLYFLVLDPDESAP